MLVADTAVLVIYHDLSNSHRGSYSGHIGLPAMDSMDANLAEDSHLFHLLVVVIHTRHSRYCPYVTALHLGFQVTTHRRPLMEDGPAICCGTSYLRMHWT